MDNNKTTHFGFKTIPAFEKASRVEALFTSVSDNYDRMNDVMSFGLHRLWKESLLSQIKLTKGSQFLDIASGTGDIALKILTKAKKENLDVNLIALDLTADMMKPARDRLLNAGLTGNVTWLQGNAEELPLADSSVDVITISFGLRNVTDIPKALSEAYRVLKPGGQFLCLEFSKIYIKPLRHLYKAYAFHIIPKMGKIVAKNEDAYQYLVESIENFPDQESLAAMMRDAGMTKVNFKNLTAGVVAIHWGSKGRGSLLLGIKVNDRRCPNHLLQNFPRPCGSCEHAFST